MERKEYSAGAVKLSLWFLEFRQMIELLSQGRSLAEIKALNEDENIFGISSPARRKQVFTTVSGRLAALGEGIYPVFMSCDLANQKLICLAAFMAHDTLFFDFVYEVIRIKLMTGENQYTDSDLRSFFNAKQMQSAKAAKWTEATFNRLGRTYKNALAASGLTDKGVKARRIFPPFVDERLADWLKANGFRPILAAIIGV